MRTSFAITKRQRLGWPPSPLPRFVQQWEVPELAGQEVSVSEVLAPPPLLLFTHRRFETSQPR